MRHVKLAAESHYPIRVRTSPRTTFRKRTYTNDKGAYTYCAGFHHILRKVPDRPFYGVVFFALVPDSCPKRNAPRPLLTKPVNIE